MRERIYLLGCLGMQFFSWQANNAIPYVEERGSFFISFSQLFSLSECAWKKSLEACLLTANEMAQDKGSSPTHYIKLPSCTFIWNVETVQWGGKDVAEVLCMKSYWQKFCKPLCQKLEKKMTVTEAGSWVVGPDEGIEAFYCWHKILNDFVVHGDRILNIFLNF